MTTVTPSPLHLGVAGAVAAATALGVASFLDGVSTAVPSLVHGVGQAIIRAAPGAVAREGIEVAGQADKPLLVAGTVVVSIALGGLLGRVAIRQPALVFGGFGAAALVGAFATAWATDASVAGSLVGAAVAAATGVALLAFLARMATPTVAEAAAPRAIGSAATRRRFLTAAGLGAAGAGSAALLGRRLQGGGVVEAARRDVVLPSPTGAAAATLPAGAESGLAGSTPIVTANVDFYRIDEALIVPSVDPATWRLEVGGMVDRPFSLSYDELLAEDLVERYVTLACVSNEVGGSLIGNARWLGVPLARLLERAGVEPGADQIVGRSVDGFTVGFPTAVALDGRDALVAVGMNGEPLPRDHGFPARLVVPGLYGYVSATKWLSSIELTTWDAFDAYWVQRGWAEEGPVRTQSRVDVPRPGGRIPTGPTTIAGVAWAQHRGIDAVEVRIDGGPWEAADLAGAISDDTWRQWHLSWEADPGRHLIEVRATDGEGAVQEEERRPVFPDGATGYHGALIEVS